MKNNQLLLLVFLWALCPLGTFAQCVIQVTDGQAYTEGFESGTMECWTVEATGTGTWSVMTGTQSNVVAFQNGAAGDQARLISPTFDLSAVGSASFSFGYAMMALYNNDVLTVSYRSSETDPWHDLDSYSVNDWSNTFEATFDLPDISSTYQISFLAQCNGGYYIFIDYIEIVAAGGCARPVNLMASNITPYSAILEWSTTGNEESWVVELDGHPQTVATQPFLMEGLMPQTTYSFRVKANCGDGMESDWSYPTSFKTTCDVITVTDDEPYFDDFEGSDDFICWRNETILGDHGWAIDPGYLILNNTAYFFWLGQEALLYSAPLDITEVTHPVLQFKRKQPLANDVDELYVAYRLSLSDNWHVIGAYMNPCNDWESEIIELPEVSATLQIGFDAIASNGEGDGVYIDEVWVGNVTDDFVGELAVPVATVYPNPASDKALVSANITDGEVTLFDLSGRRMASATLHQGRVELVLSNFAQGVYMARIASKNGATTLRLIKE